MRTKSIILAGTAFLAAVPALAQTSSDVVVMRRVVAAPIKDLNGSGQTTPTDPSQIPNAGAPNASGARWGTSDWFQTPGCGAVTDTRLVGCIGGDGRMAPDSSCSGDKPVTTMAAERYTACHYSWAPTGFGDWADGCSAKTTRPILSECRREDGIAADASSCTSPKPTVEVGQNYSSCSYAWTVGSWGAWDNACSPDANRTRLVSCARQDGEPAGDNACDPATKPAASETAGNYSGCAGGGGGAYWEASAWVVPMGCGTVTQTRTAVCKLSDGTITADAACNPASKPSLTQVTDDHRSCTFGWSVGAYSDWSSACSASATRDRSVACLRSDGEPATYDHCVGDRPESQETSAIYTNCTYSWSTSNWSQLPGCGTNVQQTRSVTCIRTDGTVAADTQCDPSARPPSTTSSADYSTCGYSWTVASYGEWSSTCGADATRTREVVCMRSDGAQVSDGQCNSDTKPAPTETSDNYAGCSYSWAIGGWSAWSSTCSANAFRTAPVSCIRHLSDGSTVAVDQMFCTNLGDRPQSTQTQVDYSGCATQWIAGSWGASNNSCSATAVQTRMVSCQATLPDGSKTTVADSSCDVATKPAASQTISDFSSCTYNWDIGTWGAWSSTCSSSATRSRTTACMRSDGAQADTSFCSTPAPATIDGPTTVVTDCTGLLQNPGFEKGNLSGWTVQNSVVIDSALKLNGSYSAKFTQGSVPQAHLMQTFATIQGRIHTLTAWGYVISGYPIHYKLFNSVGATLAAGDIASASQGSWVKITASFTGDGNPAKIDFYYAGAAKPQLDSVTIAVQ